MWARGALGALGAGVGAAAALARLPGPPARSDRRKGHAPPAPLRCDDAPLRAAAGALLTPMMQYAELHGLLYADKDTSADPSRATQCPVAMLPFQIPEKAFDDAVALSPLWNKLVDAIARDLPWLYKTLDQAALADPFTAELMKISKAVHAEGLRQPLMLGIHRSDYMLHDPEGPGDREPPRFLQVELNTIASSMLSHSFNVSKLHQYMLNRYGSMPAVQEHFGACASELASFLPENDTLRVVPAALAQAHHAYGSKTATVLFVVQDGERNFADQRWIEYALFEQHGVPVIRKTLTELHAEASMDSAGRLRLGAEEISVVYFRSGYSPDDYYSQKEWDARLTLEKSLAVKCPSVDYQLVGAKKVQQALARAGAVERFIGSEGGAKLRTSFAGLWGLGPGEDDRATLDMAFKAPDHYVLKPQREGGGNNFYGPDVATKLKDLTPEERGAYILMQRILPRLQDAVMTRGGQATIMPGLSEFGFYSVFLGDGRNDYLSKHAGHLVRTKGEGVDEGGVAAGYAVISSPFLVK